jgi:hypothetical protein
MVLMVLMVLMLRKAKVNIVLVNNASRDRGVLVIQAILEYQSISGGHLTQPEIGQKLVFVIFDKMRAVFVRQQNSWAVTVKCRLSFHVSFRDL